MSAALGDVSRRSGLPTLRRSGTVTELLFLYECLTREVPQLRSVAERLGLTVQAASHVFRQLRRRGLATIQDGRYRATVAGVAWLHEALRSLREDLDTRIERLHILRSGRAVATSPIRRDAPVVLEVRDGVLRARSGARGASRGRARTSARKGELVEVVDLHGIVPIRPRAVSILTVPDQEVMDPALPARLRQRLRGSGRGLLAAPGLELNHLVGGAMRQPILRYGVTAAATEASRLGVPTTIVVLDSELPRLLSQFDEPRPPALAVTRLAVGREGPRSRPRPRG